MISKYKTKQGSVTHRKREPEMPNLHETPTGLGLDLVSTDIRVSILREIHTTLERLLEQWDATEELLSPLFEKDVLTAMEQWKRLHELPVRFQYDRFMDGWRMSIKDETGDWLDWTHDLYRDSHVEAFI